MAASRDDDIEDIEDYEEIEGEEEEDEEYDEYDDEDDSVRRRLLPFIIMLIAVGGFAGLAWYAYTAGSKAVKDEDLLIIEADNSPVKEKPLDPGGMKFPNQDKTVFETISTNAGTTQQKENIVAAPEDPLPAAEANNPQLAEETQSWVNDKLKQQEAQVADGSVNGAKAERLGTVSPSAGAPVGLTPVEEVETEAKPAKKEVIAEASVEEKKVEEPKAKPVAEKKLEPKKEKPEVAKEEKSSNGGGMVQLAAYRSEEEAKADWVKLQKKHSALSGKKYSIVKADLGAKGIFYRLRVNASDPKALCAALSGKGQSCMVVK